MDESEIIKLETNDIELIIQKIKQLKEESKLKKAEALSREALKTFPEDIRIKILLASILVKRNRLEEAENIAREVLGLKKGGEPFARKIIGELSELDTNKTVMVSLLIGILIKKDNAIAAENLALAALALNGDNYIKSQLIQIIKRKDRLKEAERLLCEEINIPTPMSLLDNSEKVSEILEIMPNGIVLISQLVGVLEAEEQLQMAETIARLCLGVTRNKIIRTQLIGIIEKRKKKKCETLPLESVDEVPNNEFIGNSKTTSQRLDIREQFVLIIRQYESGLVVDAQKTCKAIINSENISSRELKIFNELLQLLKNRKMITSVREKNFERLCEELSLNRNL